jgi:hypothetical protein
MFVSAASMERRDASSHATATASLVHRRKQARNWWALEQIIRVDASFVAKTRRARLPNLEKLQQCRGELGAHVENLA